MVHDCAITESSVVIFDLGVVFDLELAAEGSRLPYRWDPAYAAQVGLLPREGSSNEVQWFSIDPCYVFHTLNAFDDGNQVVIDVAKHERMFATDLTGPNEGIPILERWRLDRTTGSVSTTVIADGGHEFPRIDERLTGRKHRFGYTVVVHEGGARDVDFNGALARHDLQTGESDQRTFGAGASVGEFVFVPASPEASEDDGVLMGFVHEAARETSELVVLDAQTLADVARVELPARVPVGFHGNWIPS